MQETPKLRSRWRWPAVGVAVAVIGAVAFVMARGPANVGTAKEIQRDVEVRSEGDAFESVRDHPNVKKGDVVRTSKDGLGEIEYGDGSLTRLDGGTTFAVDELLTQTKRVVRASLSEGRVWNKVEKLSGSQDQFEIHTPNAVATVRGTTFFCESEPLSPELFETTCAQIEGSTHVVWNNGAEVTLGAGQCATEGTTCKWTPAELISMLSKFAELDGVELPWKATKAESKAPDVVPSVPRGQVVSGVVKDLKPSAEPKKKAPSVENHDDDEDSDDNSDDDNDQSSEPSNFTPPSGGGGSDGGGSDGGGSDGGGSDGGCDADPDKGHGNDCSKNDGDNPGGKD